MIKDINILLSVVNTKLRDEYSSLEEFLDGYYEAEEVIKFLNANGYSYDSVTNSFK